MEKAGGLTDIAGVEFPIIMAPMFLVTNKAMLLAGMKGGILTVLPSLNFRKPGELETLLDELSAARNAYGAGNFGVNLIVQKTNPYLKKHLDICVSRKVSFYITSLGNPGEVIKAAHAYGAKVYCDVTTMAHADKCFREGCDGFIAVGQGAGGHAGPNPLQVLIPALKKRYPGTPVIAAGGITDGRGLASVKILGADGASIGTRFIASTECTVNDAYKKAVTDAGMDDIVMSTRLSGSPCTIINTPEAQKMGYSQTAFERFMSNNPRTRRWFKMLVQARGMKKLEESVLPNNYKRLWCAGKSSGLIDDVLPCVEIISNIRRGYMLAIEELARQAQQ